MPITHLLVFIEGTASKQMARVVQQVNSSPQRFPVERFTDA